MVRRASRGRFRSTLVFASFLLVVSVARPTFAAAADGSDPLLDAALAHLAELSPQLGLAPQDIAALRVTDRTFSAHIAITHLYLRQHVAGIRVAEGTVGIHVDRAGRVIHLGDRLVRGLDRVTLSGEAALSPLRAVEVAAAHLGLGRPVDLRLERTSTAADRESVLTHGGISRREIPARLVYHLGPSGDLLLAWETEIETLDQQHYWVARVDAVTGRFLAVDDLVDSERYRVYPIPVESPQHTTPAPPADARQLEVNPFEPTASPFGWHDTNGAPGAEFTITRGNNVHAYEDVSNSGSGTSPNCGASLVCDFPINLTQAPVNYQSASIANLFYWNNVVHDVMYLYGFDEISGNFQENNYGNGGLGGDAVRAEGQDGGGNCNANFLTLADGSAPRMQMYLCNLATPSRDGSLDDLVIVHEFGHGISNRLTGGPGTVSCLNNAEQMGEGWSDWFGLVFTQQTASGGVPRGIGTYLFNQAPDGVGIRPARYALQLAVNPYTYGDLPFLSIPHGVGFVWATMLWEMQWSLVATHGFNPDLYGHWTTGGNNLALQLVTDALKLQQCSPGFVDGRNAILAADMTLTGGANQCSIWFAFAKRGLGLSASQGSSASTSDGIEAFDYPAGCDALFSDGFESGDTSAWSGVVP